MERGAEESIDTTNNRDPIIGFVSANKEHILKLTLEGLKMIKIKR